MRAVAQAVGFHGFLIAALDARITYVLSPVEVTQSVQVRTG